MNVFLNGKKKELPDNTTVETLVELLKLNRELIAVEVDGNIVKKCDYKNCVLREGNEIEILTLIGGG